MNKIATFILGLVAGAAGGSVATYYIVKDKLGAEMDEEIADMEDYFEERYQKKIGEKIPEEKIEEVLEEMTDNKDNRDDEKISNNKGVKKYHHENGLDQSSYGSARIFGNDAKPKKESKLINEVSEEEFLNMENGYTKQTVDVFMSNDDEEPEIVGLWAYNTDNEENVDTRFKKSINELLNGRTYEELLTYCGDDDIGQLYLKNDELMVDFEFIIHNDRQVGEDV